MLSPETPRPDQHPPGADATAAVAAGQASIGYLLATLGPCLVLLARDLDQPRTSLSWVSSGFGVGLLLLGAVGERLLSAGAWPVLRASAVGLAAGAALLGATSSLRLAQAGALLIGLGGAGLVLATPVLLAGAEAARRLTLVVGLSSLMGIGAPLAVGALDAAAGRGRLALLVPVPALLWIAGRRRPDSDAAAEGRAGASPAGAIRRAARGWLAMVCAVCPEFAFVVWGAARLQDSGLGPAAASAAAAAFPVGMATGRLLTPRLLKRVPLVAWGVALGVGGALLAAAPAGPALVTAACALAGLGISPLYPLLLDRLVRTPGLDPRRAAAFGSLASGTAVLGAPALLALVARLVPLRLAFLAAVPFLVVVLVLDRGGRTGE